MEYRPLIWKYDADAERHVLFYRRRERRAARQAAAALAAAQIETTLAPPAIYIQFVDEVTITPPRSFACQAAYESNLVLQKTGIKPNFRVYYNPQTKQREKIEVPPGAEAERVIADIHSQMDEVPLSPSRVQPVEKSSTVWQSILKTAASVGTTYLK